MSHNRDIKFLHKSLSLFLEMFNVVFLFLLLYGQESYRRKWCYHNIDSEVLKLS
jgi:hypothetical protein